MTAARPETERASPTQRTSSLARKRERAGEGVFAQRGSEQPIIAATPNASPKPALDETGHGTAHDGAGADARIHDAQLRVGVVGAGRWGRNLVRTLDGLGVLAGVAEAAPSLRAAVSADHQTIAVYEDASVLLATDVDAVVIATPASTHHAVAKAALLAGKDVFVEKPLTLATPEARELVGLAREHNRILMVGHMLLYQPAIRFLRDMLARAELGRTYSLHARRRNLGTVRQHENALFSLGVHDLAVLRFLVGQPVERVTAVGQAALQPGIEDDAHVHLRFRGGVRAHLHVSWQWPVKDRGLTIVCERGAYEYDELAQTITLRRAFASPTGTTTDSGSEVVFAGAGEPLKLEMEHFLACVRTRKTPDSPGEQGLEIVELMHAATRQLQEQA